MKSTLNLFGLILNLIVLILFPGKQLQAQVVTEDVHFDFYQSAANNDFANYFNGLTTITQSQTNGITGGCLLLTDSIDWGNDRGIYCSAYHPLSGDTTVTAVSFKFDSTTIHVNSFQRAMTIFMHPWSDPNHYVIATVSGTKKLELITYGWVNTPYPSLNLLHNHWYRYLLTTAFNATGFQVYIKAEVYDLGTSGISTPLFVNSSSHTITDNFLAVDTAIQVAISGAKFGGGIYLDDFHFHGRKGISNCVINTGFDENKAPEEIRIYPAVVRKDLTIIRNDKSTGPMKVSIFNLMGEKLLLYETNKIKSEIDISSFANGIYIVNCETKTRNANAKIILNKQ